MRLLPGSNQWGPPLHCTTSAPTPHPVLADHHEVASRLLACGRMCSWCPLPALPMVPPPSPLTIMTMLPDGCAPSLRMLVTAWGWRQLVGAGAAVKGVERMSAGPVPPGPLQTCHVARGGVSAVSTTSGSMCVWGGVYAGMPECIDVDLCSKHQQLCRIPKAASCCQLVAATRNNHTTYFAMTSNWYAAPGARPTAV
jgi:hypothetical protein